MVKKKLSKKVVPLDSAVKRKKKTKKEYRDLYRLCSSVFKKMEHARTIFKDGIAALDGTEELIRNMVFDKGGVLERGDHE